MSNDINYSGKKHCVEISINEEGSDTQKLILEELRSLHKTIENGFLHMRKVSKKVNKMSEKVKLLELYQIQQLSKNKKKFIRNNVKLFQKKSKKSCSQPKTSANSSETSQANNNTNINCFVKTSTFMNDSNLLQKQSITEKDKDFFIKNYDVHDEESIGIVKEETTGFNGLNSKEQGDSDKFTLSCKKVISTTEKIHNDRENVCLQSREQIGLKTNIGGLEKVGDERKDYKIKKPKKKDKTKKKKSKKSKKDKLRIKLKPKHKSKKKDKQQLSRQAAQYNSFDEKISSLVKSTFNLTSPKFVFDPLETTIVESKEPDIYQHSQKKYRKVESFSNPLKSNGDHSYNVNEKVNSPGSSSNSENDIDIKVCDLIEFKSPSIVIQKTL